MSKMKGAFWVGFFSLVSLASEAPQTAASTLMEMSVSEMARNANSCFRLRINAIENATIRDLPHLRMQAQVVETLRGVPPAQRALTFALPGGRSADGRRYSVSGTPDLVVGQQYLMCFQRGIDNGAELQLVGWTAYRVSETSGGEKYLMRMGERVGGDGRFRASSNLLSYDQVVEEIFEQN